MTLNLEVTPGAEFEDIKKAFTGIEISDLSEAESLEIF